jgi:hypothetical protein
MDREAAARAMLNPDTMASAAHAVALELFGEQYLQWEPLTIVLELKAELGEEPHPVVMDRISAMRIAISTDAFFRRFEGFSAIVNTLSTGSPFFDVFDPVTLEEIAWAVTEVALNRDMPRFERAITGYTRMLLKAGGFQPGEYPVQFREMFKARPSAHEVATDAAGEDALVIDEYVKEQLQELTRQFIDLGLDTRLDELIAARMREETAPEEDE